MEFRCIRIGNLFVKRVAMQMLLPLSVCLFPTIIILATGDFSWFTFLALCLIALLIAIRLVVDYPTALFLDNQCLIWTELLHVTDSSRDSNLATVTVGDLHAIRFQQCAIERLFNIGRICFMGDIRSIDSGKPVDRPQIPFIYGGIKHFEQFKTTLENRLPVTAFLRPIE